MYLNGLTVKMLFEGKNLYGQYIDCSEKKKWPKGFICPYTWTIFYNTCIYSRSQVSVYRTIGPLVILKYLHSYSLAYTVPECFQKELTLHCFHFVTASI